jgi:hypothetical protein
MRLTLLLLLTACAVAVRPEPPILAQTTLPYNLALTVCSLNNQPVVLIDSAVFHSPDGEIVLLHERVHAERMAAYKGGCWPFMLRYRADSAFRVREEFAAYCAEGEYAIRRNRQAVYAWERIVQTMRERYGVRLTPQQNCLFESWLPDTSSNGDNQ